jgi:hypothetical protein
MTECKTHKFVKFDDDRIFCERCGLFMLAARQAPVYVPDWTYRPYVQPAWPHWYQPTITTAPVPRPFITVWNGTNSMAATAPTTNYVLPNTTGTLGS